MRFIAMFAVVVAKNDSSVLSRNQSKNQNNDPKVFFMHNFIDVMDIF
jgi:hypothetical protein